MNMFDNNDDSSGVTSQSSTSRHHQKEDEQDRILDYMDHSEQIWNDCGQNPSRPYRSQYYSD
jgi:hypothetical protein